MTNWMIKSNNVASIFFKFKINSLMIIVKRKTEIFLFFFNHSYSTPAFCILICFLAASSSQFVEKGVFSPIPQCKHTYPIPTISYKKTNIMCLNAARGYLLRLIISLFFSLESLPPKKKQKQHPYWKSEGGKVLLLIMQAEATPSEVVPRTLYLVM